MPPEDREAKRLRIARVMAGVAEGDGVAISELFELATSPVRGMILGRFGQAGIWLPSDLIDDLVRDLVVELIELAPSWRPDGGASPWQWARHRLVALAFANVGQFCDDIDDHHLLPERASDERSSGDSEDGWATLCALSSRHPAAADLAQVLEEAVGERDRRVWLDYEIEKANGNRSPAVTVAELHEVTPALARKIVQRVRTKLLSLATEGRAELAGVTALAA